MLCLGFPSIHANQEVVTPLGDTPHHRSVASYLLQLNRRKSPTHHLDAVPQAYRTEIVYLFTQVVLTIVLHPQTVCASGRAKNADLWEH